MITRHVKTREPALKMPCMSNILQKTDNVKHVKLEVFTAVRMMILFWVLVLCRLADRCQRFGETYCLHLQGWSEAGNGMFLRNFASICESTGRQNPEQQHNVKHNVSYKELFIVTDL
jgi:hypothetical protein